MICGAKFFWRSKKVGQLIFFSCLNTMHFFIVDTIEMVRNKWDDYDSGTDLRRVIEFGKCPTLKYNLESSTVEVADKNQ